MQNAALETPTSHAVRHDRGLPIPAQENFVLDGSVSGVSKISTKGRMANIFQLCGQMVSVTTIQPYHCRMKVAIDDKHLSESVWPCSNKTLFTKTEIWSMGPSLSTSGGHHSWFLTAFGIQPFVTFPPPAYLSKLYSPTSHRLQAL